MAKPINPEVARATFPVWLSRDMAFNDPQEKVVKKYHKFTKAEKVKYTKKIEQYLSEMEDKPKLFGDTDSGRAVAIKLDGRVRYVWRADVLTEAEYNEVKKRHRVGVDMLRQKLNRPVDKELSQE